MSDFCSQCTNQLTKQIIESYYNFLLHTEIVLFLFSPHTTLICKFPERNSLFMGREIYATRNNSSTQRRILKTRPNKLLIVFMWIRLILGWYRRAKIGETFWLVQKKRESAATSSNFAKIFLSISIGFQFLHCCCLLKSVDDDTVQCLVEAGYPCFCYRCFHCFCWVCCVDDDDDPVKRH